MNLRHFSFDPFGILTLLWPGLDARTGAKRYERWITTDRYQDLYPIVDPSTLAHELSTPLSALNVLTEMMAEGHAGADEQREIAQAIKSELRILKSLIEDVERLSSAGIQSFVLDPKPVQVLDLFRQTAFYARVLDPDVDIAIDCAPGTLALADPQRIQQVLRNLVANAVRYSPPGTPIVLRASRALDRVRIQVIDRGPGISPRHLPSIFEKHVRGPNHGHVSLPGKGLGLFVCREIVEAHGSQLEVQSTAREGTTFAFELRNADDQTPPHR